MPAARHTGLDDVRGEVVGALVQGRHLLGRRHAPTLGRQARPEDVGDESQCGVLADRTRRAALCADVARRSDQFGVGVAHLVLSESPAPELVDEVTARQPVVDDTSTGATQRAGGELPLAFRRHAHRGYRRPGHRAGDGDRPGPPHRGASRRVEARRRTPIRQEATDQVPGRSAAVPIRSVTLG